MTSFIIKCLTCQVKRTYENSIMLRILTTVPFSESFARVGMDIMGPLITTTEGHKFVIVAMCYLTKWVEVQASESQGGKNLFHYTKIQNKEDSQKIMRKCLHFSSEWMESVIWLPSILQAILLRSLVNCDWCQPTQSHNCKTKDHSIALGPSSRDNLTSRFCSC